MKADAIKRLGEELYLAEVNRKQIEAPTDRYPDISTGEAYQVQNEYLTRKIDAGQHIVGKKIGLTSKAIQQALGVDEPDYGQLLDSFLIHEYDVVRLDELIQPRAEGEIALVLEKDLDMEYITPADVLRCTAFVMPAIEIIDSRISDWKIRLQDTIADNASSARFALGGKKTLIDDLDLRYTGMSLWRNGAVQVTGAGAAALGNPVIAVAWLGNKLREFGVTMRCGEIILSGGLAAPVTLSAQDSVRVSVQDLGDVTVRFE